MVMPSFGSQDRLHLPQGLFAGCVFRIYFLLACAFSVSAFLHGAASAFFTFHHGAAHAFHAFFHFVALHHAAAHAFAAFAFRRLIGWLCRWFVAGTGAFYGFRRCFHGAAAFAFTA
jgi:hypothetical protein